MRVRSWKWESEVKEGEKKRKIINVRVIVTVHICIDTVTLVYKCTVLHPLTWVFFFGSNCVKWNVFSVVRDFTFTDVNVPKNNLIWNFLRLGVKTLFSVSNHTLIDLTCVAYYMCYVWNSIIWTLQSCKNVIK